MCVLRPGDKMRPAGVTDRQRERERAKNKHTQNRKTSYIRLQIQMGNEIDFYRFKASETAET